MVPCLGRETMDLCWWPTYSESDLGDLTLVKAWCFVSLKILTQTFKDIRTWQRLNPAIRSEVRDVYAEIILECVYQPFIHHNYHKA